MAAAKQIRNIHPNDRINKQRVWQTAYGTDGITFGPSGPWGFGDGRERSLNLFQMLMARGWSVAEVNQELTERFWQLVANAAEADLVTDTVRWLLKDLEEDPSYRPKSGRIRVNKSAARSRRNSSARKKSRRPMNRESFGAN